MGGAVLSAARPTRRRARHKGRQQSGTEDRLKGANGRPSVSMRHRCRFARRGRCAWTVTRAKLLRDALGATKRACTTG
eukprot:6053517-Lingulodinium_polyedra.AAC.1